MKKLFVIALSFLMIACTEEDSCSPIPTLTTDEVSNITDTSVTISGTIEAPTCDPTVTSQGFVYSLNTLPKITDEFIEVNGKAISKEITGLQQNRTYYYRTYFTNPTGTYYGKEIMFKTEVGAALLNSNSVINIKAFSADVSSNIVSSGGGDIIARGVCWSINPNPTIADSKTEEGSGLGSFTSNLTGLTLNTTYYVRSYATNEVGTTYGEEVTFTTKDGIITLSTNTISEIRPFSAISGGNITDDGGAEITVRGVCWSTNPNPTTADSKTEDSSGIESFTSSLIELTENTTYYVRGYATNEVGTNYGNEIIFKTAFANPVYLDDNGITVKARNSAQINDVGIIDGVEYTLVDKEMLDEIIQNGEDVTTVCTTKITDMNSMFLRIHNNFNQDLSAWDVGNVTTMDAYVLWSMALQPRH